MGYPKYPANYKDPAMYAKVPSNTIVSQRVGMGISMGPATRYVGKGYPKCPAQYEVPTRWYGYQVSPLYPSAGAWVFQWGQRSRTEVFKTTICDVTWARVHPKYPAQYKVPTRMSGYQVSPLYPSAEAWVSQWGQRSKNRSVRDNHLRV